MATPHEPPDWAPAEVAVMRAHGWAPDGTGTVRRRTGNAPVPLVTVLDTLTNELAPRRRPHPATLSPAERAFLTEHGLTVGDDGSVRTAKGEAISRALLHHLVTRHHAEVDHPGPPGRLMVHRTLGQQSDRTPWS